eukprot:2326623-Pyramimonas_sp.AAC.1
MRAWGQGGLDGSGAQHKGDLPSRSRRRFSKRLAPKAAMRRGLALRRGDRNQLRAAGFATHPFLPQPFVRPEQGG